MKNDRLSKNDIELLAIDIFKQILKLNDKYIIYYEKLIKNRKKTDINALKHVDKNYYTPDFIISNNFQNDKLEELFFLDINEPEGSLLSESGIEIAQGIQKEINLLKDNEIKNIEINSNLIKDYVLSKLNKINNKYALNRNKKGSISFNNGIIFILNYERDKTINNDYNFNLAYLQWEILLKEALETLSDGKCNYSDIKDLYNNQFISFNFVEKYKNISFVLFIENEVAENYNYFIINDYFLLNSNNVLSKILKQHKIGNGNIFKNYSIKDRIYIEIEKAVIDDNTIVYPYGYKNYLENLNKGLK